MAKKKFYAVAAGRSCGIYTDWATTEKLVKGFAGAKYKSFPSRVEAEAWLDDPVYQKKQGSAGSKSKGPSAPSAKIDDPNAIIVYTDGGAINNPGPGGYGIVIEQDGCFQELSGGFRLTTNNRMEMMAAIVALKQIRDTLQGSSKKIYLYSDSSYLVNGITKGWARKWRSRGWRKSDGESAINIDLWKALLELTDELEVSFNWVKGHAGNELNERCDRLAVSAARGTDMASDTEYEKTVQEV